MAQVGNVFSQRGRTDSKVLSKRFDADGNIVDVEWREDEEQNVKLQETVDLLLAAGYFRARIKGLSPFDKVVGGMTWCIETCNVDIDVDLLFQENLTIGQKIALTEKIVAVLPKMKCPHRLEPHQIQGLDFIHIFPVVQWLVRRAIETREELGDTIRAYSMYQFNKNFKLPEDEIANQQIEKSLATATHVMDTYKPRRMYRRNVAQQIEEESIRVQSTILEYGKHLSLARSSSSKTKDESSRRSSVDNEEAAVDEQVRTLMSGMSASEESELRLSASTVSSIVDHQQMASAFEDKMQLSSLGISEKLGGTQQHKRMVDLLNKQINQRSALLKDLEERQTDLQAQYSAKQNKLTEVVEFNKSIENDMIQFEELDSGENKNVLDKLRALIAMNECLKMQEHEFKAHCKEELVRLQKNLDELNSENVEDDSENQERSQLIETQYQSDKDRLNKIRLLLARKNREIATIQRKIDEVPSRAELSQYQRRFVELYNQVAAKHKETKQFYTLYNTLDDTKLYLSKEVNLLNSISDNFTEAMSSPVTKEQFLKQFENIVEGIKTNKSKLEKKKQEEKMRRDQLSDAYLDLVEKQRLYFKTVKDLKEECRKNELLIAKMKGHGQ